MRIKLTLKDPDGVSYAIDKILKDCEIPEDVDAESFIELKRERIQEYLAPWVQYSEYVTIVIDTDAGTATVERTS